MQLLIEDYTNEEIEKLLDESTDPEETIQIMERAAARKAGSEEMLVGPGPQEMSAVEMYSPEFYERGEALRPKIEGDFLHGETGGPDPRYSPEFYAAGEALRPKIEGDFIHGETGGPDPRQVAVRRMLQQEPLSATAPTGDEDLAAVDEFLGSDAMTMGSASVPPRQVIQARRGGMMDLVGSGSGPDLGSGNQAAIVDRLVASRANLGADRAKQLSSEMYRSDLEEMYPAAPADPVGLAYIRDAAAKARLNQKDLEYALETGKAMRRDPERIAMDEIEALNDEMMRDPESQALSMAQEREDRGMRELRDMSARLMPKTTAVSADKPEQVLADALDPEQVQRNMIEDMVAKRSQGSELLSLMPTIKRFQEQLGRAGVRDTGMDSLESRVKMARGGRELFALDPEVRNIARGKAASAIAENIAGGLGSVTASMMKQASIENAREVERKKIAGEVFSGMNLDELTEYGKQQDDYMNTEPSVRNEYMKALKDAKAKLVIMERQAKKAKDDSLAAELDRQLKEAEIALKKAQAKKAGEPKKEKKPKQTPLKVTELSKDLSQAQRLIDPSNLQYTFEPSKRNEIAKDITNLRKELSIFANTPMSQSEKDKASQSIAKKIDMLNKKILDSGKIVKQEEDKGLFGIF